MRKAISNLELSIRRISEKAEAQDECVRFDIGQPSFDTPQHVKEYVKEKAIQEKQGYAPVKGIGKLRKEILKEEKNKKGFNNLELSEDNILVTVGGMGALYTIFAARLESKDKAVFNDPCWGPYKMISAVNGNEFTQVEYWDENKELREEAKKEIRNAELVVVNTPSNPTGKILTKKQAKEIAEYAEKHKTFLVSDEVYHKLIYEKEHHSPAKYTQESAIIGSVSKNHAMTGWRIGWILDKKENIDDYAKAARASTACPPKISQQAAYEALKNDEHVEEMVKTYRERRDLLVKKMKEVGWDFEIPEGAIYAFPNIGEDSWNYCLQMIENGVSMVPGEPMGPKSDRNVRICFGSVKKSEIKKAFDIIEENQ